MSHRVTVKPSGHSFEAEGHESVLDAGLREGLNLPYGCANGSCGTCRARLLSGSLSPHGHADYVFPAAERESGWFLMCRQRPNSDLLIETREPDKAAEIPHQHLVAKVAKVERLQDEVILLQLRTPRSSGLQFLAGQSVELAFDGMRPHCLPIASCPCDGMYLRFHVRYRADDPFSNFVFNGLKKGKAVVVSGPVGDFTLDQESRRPLIFVAWEAGFAPVESLIDHAIQLDAERPMHLYWLSAIPRGHYLSNYCRAWVDALDDFHYHSVDLAPVGDATLESTLQEIVAAHRPLADWDLYLSLPPPLGEQAMALLEASGVPADRVRLGPLCFPAER